MRLLRQTHSRKKQTLRQIDRENDSIRTKRKSPIDPRERMVVKKFDLLSFCLSLSLGVEDEHSKGVFEQGKSLKQITLKIYIFSIKNSRVIKKKIKN
jgi:hypothetical protein